ncbi:hydroxymethylglutaryl-CoA synthase [Lacticaseibacillus baoqingensis]|uniref:Hydroxymethylglutaryl-CoA synthase n=1 Tax=Lacticaseibacillus baoqingensis TaxID=2486013 RepID=A0ABW4E4F7_9LACO|nr:hydroxymethylglutaryl-CoA synthase [Lacticaseibacillus baoqingensis]
MKIGIDQIGLATPAFYLDLVELAKARGDDPDKYTIGIGQDEQAVAPSSQDVVTLGASAADFLSQADRDELGLIVVGTETGVDASKASALYIHALLGLNPWCRAIEIKEACYGGTAALMMARDYVAAHPTKKALVIAADIARYGLNSGGEVTQGAGAIAMLITAQPRLLAIHDDAVVKSGSIMDFWRPVYTDLAIAKGKYSTEQYLAFFQATWQRYSAETGHGVGDFEALCFHLPYTKMGLKALKTVLPEVDEPKQAALMANFEASCRYSRRIGNIYTGSLYLGLLSLLESNPHLQAGALIGLFSYGSGAVGEFFSAEVQPEFNEQLHPAAHQQRLTSRRRLSVAEYEAVFADKVPYAAADYHADPAYFAGSFVLTDVIGQQRQYRRL